MFRRGQERIYLSLRNVSDSSTASRRTKLNIQPFIAREPTDVLKALSETVGIDQTAPHFAFIDDPLTIPSTANAKRAYFMAKEMGKRAARELAEEWPTLFAFDRDTPRLEVFRPENPADPLKVDPTEANLLTMVDKRQVRDACMLYERMRSEGHDISEKSQLRLLQLVAYYNGYNVPFAEWELWPGMRNYGDDSENPRRNWQNGGVADLIYEALPKSTETTSIMISGLCKYPSKDHIDRAKKLYKELKGSKQAPMREAYDGLLAVSSWSEAKALLQEMAVNKIAPTHSTWNSLLKCASKIQAHNDRLKAFSSVLGEMRTCGVQPSLQSFHLIVSNLIDQTLASANNTDAKDSQEPNSQSSTAYQNQLKIAISCVSEIVDQLETRLKNGETIEVESASCHLFFAEAIAVAYRAANIGVAQRIVGVYESKHNNVEMPSFTTESQFYNRHLQLYIMRSDSIEDIAKIYRSYVPRLVGVSRSLTRLVVEKLRKHQNWALLRRLVEDGISSRQMTDGLVSGEFRQLLLQIEYHALSVAEREEFAALVQKMVSIWVEFSRFTEDTPSSKRMQYKMSPPLISDCALLLSRVGDMEKAYELLDLILDEDARSGSESTVTSLGFARPDAMAELFENALRQKDPLRAATCLEIMSLNSNRNKLEPLAKRIHERCALTESQSRLINSFVRLRPQ